MFTNTDLMDAALCCERIRQRMENEKFASGSGATFSLTVSFGLSPVWSAASDAGSAPLRRRSGALWRQESRS